MLGHYTTPPVSLSIPIGCPRCQRNRARWGSDALAMRGKFPESWYPESSGSSVSSTWNQTTPAAGSADKWRPRCTYGFTGCFVLETHLAPLAATGVPGAGPEHALGDVDDDAPYGAVVQIALRCVMLADGARVICMIGHQAAQPTGVNATPIALDEGFDAVLA